MFDTKASVNRLRAIGINADQADQLVKLIQKWITCSGEERTVKRIKAYKVNLLRHFAGLPPIVVVIGPDSEWVKYGPKGPKGPFGALFRLPKSKFRKAWNAVMVYTGLVAQQVTTRQWNKMVGAIRRKPLGSEELVEALQLVHKSPFSVTVKVEGMVGSPLVDYQVSPSRRSPKGFNTVPEVNGVLDSVMPLIRRTTWSVRNWDILQGSLRGLENQVWPDLMLNQEDEEKAGGEPLPIDCIPEMGTISLIPEGGYKLRFAANPYRVYQMALKPLGDALFEALRSVPNDFTFDQQAGVDLIQHYLSLGLPAASMDLSSATDNAPLDAQLELLSRLGVSTRWLQFFRDCCRGTWFVRKDKSAEPVSIHWTVGSPLGLYPTFASFALWHHCVVQYCFSVLGAPMVESRYPYAIVGDDVTICNTEVALLYRSLMESWGVPIAEDKTLFSPTTAEFLGRIVTANTVIHGLKWKGRISDESFVDVAREIGPGMLQFMRPRQRRILQFIADLPYPYGLGWNPLGIPLEERLTPLIERLWSRDERVRSFSRRAARSARLVYESSMINGRLPDKYLDAEFLGSDQLPDDVMTSMVPLFSPYMQLIIAGKEGLDWLWPNLPEVARLNAGTPLASSAELRLMLSRTSYVERRNEATTLVVLERKVRSLLARSR